jgi:ferrochelatase
MSKGVLLVNLGSPDSSSVGDVRRYLREFLMDGRVIDVAWPLRALIVGLILINRPRQSAGAYRKIWTSEGSPLIVTSRHVQAELQKHVNMPVELAMRYQNPSIPNAIRKLRECGVNELFLIPLFPHYAMSSYESAVERVKEIAAKLAPQMLCSRHISIRQITSQRSPPAQRNIWRRAMIICCSVSTVFRNDIFTSLTRQAATVW